MSLAVGTHIGPYEVLGPIGAGGMGEVYRARDLRLERDVALKVLPSQVAADPDRLARMMREAKTLASLEHPNIAAIHGLEEDRGVLALAMELVAGEDLAQRLTGGPLPLDEALAVARQIAEALEAAHEHGIVHRDLKPANIKLKPDGTVKVLDFGLAKVVEPVSSAADAAVSPTLSAHATALGVILGTAAYMAPEQAKGRSVDRRADLWAFGVVLYEMLSGRRAFEGDDVSETLAAVLRDTPDLQALPASTPPAIRRLLRRCLAKDPKRRLADASSARLEIDEALAEPAPSAPLPRRPGVSARERWLWAAALVAIALVSLGRPWKRPSASPPLAPEVRFKVATPSPTVGPIELSPDGRQLTYAIAAEAGAAANLWLHSLDSGATRQLQQLPGSGGQSFWSPDNRSVAFFANQKLRRLDIESGVVRTLAEAPTPRGGAWNADGTILFAPAGNGPLVSVPAAGGATQTVTHLANGIASHRFPEFLPDGKHFLFWTLGPAAVRGEYLGSLDTSETHRLLDADGPAVFAPPDQVLFVREGVLLAQRLDLARRTLVGDPVPVASPVSSSPTSWTPVSSSANGIVAYREAARVRRQLVWRDRAGRQLATVGEPFSDLSGAVLSPDGRTVAVSRFDSGRGKVWLLDVQRKTLSPLSSDAGAMVWSPDGRRLAFSTGRNGLLDLFSRDLTAGADEALLVTNEGKNLFDWSADGRYLLYASQSATTARDLYALPLQGEGKPIPVATEEAEEFSGRFSPDGKWIAYVSDDTGRYEIYVRPFPGRARATRASTAGGSRPLWRRDGKELYYVTEGHLVAVPVAYRDDGIEFGSPARLFPVALGPAVVWSADGERFLDAVPLDDVPPPAITVIVNWRSGLANDLP